MIKDDERIDKINENLVLIQKKDGLTFGTDAYLLYAYMKKSIGSVAAELGSGTGVIALLALSKNKFSKIFAVEVQESFADIISRNAELNSLAERLSVLNCDVREINQSSVEKEVNVVFSNPPYMTVTSGKANENDEKYIARHEVMGDIKDFCAAAARITKHGGSFYAVYRPDRLCDIISAMKENRLEPKRMTFVHSDREHSPSLVLIEARKGGAGGVFVTKPLLLNDILDDGRKIPSKDIEYIYTNGEFDEQFERP